MAESYIPVFLDWVEVTEQLNDQEKGRLVDALVLYARGEDWQDRIKGNERFLFPALRKMIDRSAEISEKRRQAGSSGGYQKVANRSKTKQSEAKPTEEEKEEEKEKEDKRENTKEKTLEREFESLWFLYPRKQGKKRAFEAFCRDRKKGTTVEQIRQGIEAYVRYIQAEGTEEQYIKQGDTFFAQAAWQDQWTPRRKTVGRNGIALLPESDIRGESIFD